MDKLETAGMVQQSRYACNAWLADARQSDSQHNVSIDSFDCADQQNARNTDNVTTIH